VSQGEGEWVDNKGNFMITINGTTTKGMSIGPNEFKLFVKSNFALRPDIYSGVLITVPNTMIIK
jgi:hypothetical protein